MIPFLKDDIKGEIIELAKSNHTEEICGLIVQRNDTSEYVVFPAVNIADDKTTNFTVDETTQLIAEETGDIICVYHTHFTDDEAALLSRDDIKYSKLNEVPYLLYHTEFNEWDYFDPANINPYLIDRGNPSTVEYYEGWFWEWDRCDCWTLVRAYCNGVLGYNIEDFPRPQTMEEIFLEGWDTFGADLLPSRGFTKVNRHPRKNDVVLISLQGTTAHHVGVMVNDKAMLHHPQPGHLSGVILYGGIYEDRTVSVWEFRG